MMQKKLDALRRILDESKYSVALCGSGMIEEGGFVGIKNPDKAYEIELKYGASPEDIFNSAYYNARTDKFFDFYKKEILSADLQPTKSSYALASIERAGKLQCIITSNIYEMNQRGGCENVINLHGSIYQNKCPHCGRTYSMEYMKESQKVPLCENCHTVIRPMVSLFGEMVDSRLMTKTTEEIEKAEVLLLLGTTLDSEVFSTYIKYFGGKTMIIIHKEEHFNDYKADMVIYEEPQNVLYKLGYE